jgi:hypothetical protein
MSERSRTAASPGSLAGAPSAEDVRRQLEGGLETVEAARECYAALESLLSGRKWKRRLGEQPEVLQAVLGQERVLEEALERVHRRARTERWPEELPVLATVRQVRALRGRLESLIRKRLGELAPVSGAPSLAEDLSRLEGLVPPPVSLAPVAGEVLLSEGTAVSDSWRWLQFPLWCGTMMLARTVARDITMAWVIGGTMGLIVSLGSDWLRRGRFLLTQERLVWKPARGEPVQLSLRSIAENGIEFSLRGLRVVGEREIFIRDRDQRLSSLALLLDLHRHPPLLGGLDPERRVDVVWYPATLDVGTFARKGYAVLRPGYVAFLPMEMGWEVLRAIIGRSPSSSMAIGVPTILEQLRYLASGAAFDACVERAVAAVGGELWRAGEVLRYAAHTPVRKRLHFQTIDRPQKTLIGKVARDQRERAEHILAGWPKR